MSYVDAVTRRLRIVKRRTSEAVYGPEIAPWPGNGSDGIELIYWRPEDGRNFGDELSRVVVQLMLARRGMTPEDKLPKRRRMVAIGSMLHQAQSDTVVWGTGRNGLIPDRAHVFDRLDVRAIRGPRTAEFLHGMGIATPSVYGDPALLLPQLVGDRFRKGAIGGPVFVPNLNELRAGVAFNTLDVPIIDPRRDWNRVVAELLAYDYVIASSLHGLVVAEAFGIPARYVRLSDTEPLFKYHVYHEGTGRTGLTWATSIVEALEMGGMPAPASLNNIVSALAAAFPYDLWETADSA